MKGVNIKKRILFIIPAFNMGGTNKVLLTIFSYLDRKKYDVSLYVIYPIGPLGRAFSRENILEKGHLISFFVESVKKELFYSNVSFRKYFIRYIVLILRKITGESFLRNFVFRIEGKRLDKLNFDTVIAFQERDATWLVSSIKETKTIAWIHSDFNEYMKRVVLDEFYRYKTFTYIVCVSNFTKKTFLDNYSSLNSRALSITNPINEQTILEQSAYPSNVVHKFDTKVFSIVSIGRLSKEKQFTSIPSIASQLKSLGCKFVWYIIGAGNEKNNILKMISKFNMEETVIMLGELSNPYYLVNQANLIVSTSHSEACPTVFNEAKVLNTPILTTNFPSAIEFIDSGTNGVITNLNNMAEEIFLLMSDSEYYNNIKQNTKIDANINQMICKQYDEIF